MITAFINDLKEGYIDDGMKLLAAHRRLLLEELHREQKQIDCLDYLVYKMKKTKNMSEMKICEICRLKIIELKPYKDSMVINYNS